MSANDQTGTFSWNLDKLRRLTKLRAQAFAVLMDVLSDDQFVYGRVERVHDGFFVDFTGTFEGKEVYLTRAVALLLEKPFCSIGIHCSYPLSSEPKEVSGRLLAEVGSVMEGITGTPFSFSTYSEAPSQPVAAA